MVVKYNKIGTDYNLTRRADKYLTTRILHHLNPDKEGNYLDIGCGTGNYTSELQNKGFQFIGIDPSAKMLQRAKQKNSIIEWKIGTAEKMDLLSESIDGAICSLTIHHWTDLKKSFHELNRVLKIGGRFVIFTSTPKQMTGYWLNHYFPKMLEESILQMPSFQKVKLAMQAEGFVVKGTENYSVKPDLEDQFLYCGKQNPELYFKLEIRNGISSFTSLSNRKEVEQGLIKLRNDIESGAIKDIISSYENNFGDYLFIIGNKAKG